MDRQTYDQLKQLKTDIEKFLQEADKELRKTSTHFFDDPRWYDKFVWSFSDGFFKNQARFILKPKDETAFKWWLDQYSTMVPVREAVAAFNNALDQLGLTCASIYRNPGDPFRLKLQWDLTDDNDPLLFLIKNGEIEFENKADVTALVDKQSAEIKFRTTRILKNLQMLDGSQEPTEGQVTSRTQFVTVAEQ